MSLRTTALATVAAGAVAGQASATLFINEVLGSTSGSDWEFIEIYSDAGPVDLTGYSIELWDSDNGGSFGGADGSSPYALSGSTDADGFYLAIGGLALAGYGSPAFEQALPANAVENSSYTIILKDDLGAIVDSVFVTDGGAGDVANEAGNPLVPGATVGPDGTFVPAGFFRTTDGGATFGLLSFGTGDLNDGTAEGGTPGVTNVIPEPASLALLGLGGLIAARRRRSA
ncbi:MAG: PEP-CTERM sorting domain-containing protein [Planctomycetota bacterium]